MTNFQSRELVRDELVTLFAATGKWAEVYGYFPAVTEVAGKSPVLIIRSRGTQQRMAGRVTNPASYRFLLSSFVLAYTDNGTWSSADAEDKLDELDTEIRQVIRDNANLTNADVLRFDEGGSQVIDTIIEGQPYIVETRTIIAELVRGAV